MVKFYVDAYADMFGQELVDCGLELAPSKIKKCRTTTIFKGYDKNFNQTQLDQDIKAQKYQIVPLTYEEWYEFFEKELLDGNDVVFFSVSTKLYVDKGVAIKKVFKELNKKFPTRTAILVDTQTVSRGTSEIATLTRIVFDKQQNLDEALDFADTIIGKFVSVFAVDSAESLKNSQLLKNSMENFTGASVNIKPILCIDTEGNVKVLDKAKTFKSAVSKLYSNVKENGLNIADYTFSIVSFNADAEATSLYNKFREVVSENEIRLVPLSLNNAILTGGKCVALTFHSKY